MSFANSQQRQLDLFSHCVPTKLSYDTLQIVFEKNYRLQDIQLSKNRLRASRFGVTSRFALSTRPHRRYGLGEKAGGEYRARTGDLLVANQALSQLS